MRGLGDKVVVVCAGGTGDGTWIGPSIGGVTARRLAAEGAKVVVGDLDEAAAHRTAALIVSDGGTAVGQHYEAADEESARRLMARAETEFGGIDGMHFNAIDTSPDDVDGEHDLTTVPLDVWHRRLDVGLLGFVLAARFAIPQLVARGVAESCARRRTPRTSASRCASRMRPPRRGWVQSCATSHLASVATGFGRTRSRPVSFRAR